MAAVDLSPGVLDITGVRAGDRNAIGIKVTDNDGAPLNLTGYTITAQGRQTPLAPGAINATIEDINAAAGTFTLRWAGDDVRTLLGTAASFTGVWDCQIKQAVGDALTIMAGKFGAVMDVTRPGETMRVDAPASRGTVRGVANGERVRGTV
jgi:hypothetical protein